MKLEGIELLELSFPFQTHEVEQQFKMLLPSEVILRLFTRQRRLKLLVIRDQVVEERDEDVNGNLQTE